MTLNLDRNSDWVNFLKCLKVSRTAKNLLRFTVIIRQHFVYHAILAKITIQFVAKILRKKFQNVIEKNKKFCTVKIEVIQVFLKKLFAAYLLEGMKNAKPDKICSWNFSYYNRNLRKIYGKSSKKNYWK